MITTYAEISVRSVILRSPKEKGEIMTVKVTYIISAVGDTMVDNFDITLTEFIQNISEYGIGLEEIVKIEVV